MAVGRDLKEPRMREQNSESVREPPSVSSRRVRITRPRIHEGCRPECRSPLNSSQLKIWGVGSTGAAADDAFSGGSRQARRADQDAERGGGRTSVSAEDRGAPADERGADGG